MSKQIATIENTGKRGVEIQLTEFLGPVGNCKMLQVTQGLGTALGPNEPGFIQLKPSDAEMLGFMLVSWSREAKYKSFYFTLGSGHGGPGYIEIKAEDYGIARDVMVEHYGKKWAFQYYSLEDVHPLDRIKKGELCQV